MNSLVLYLSLIFFFNDTATTEIYTLSLHDALPIFWTYTAEHFSEVVNSGTSQRALLNTSAGQSSRSEEHTSELQSRPHLVCRLLLEKKKNHPIPQLPQITTSNTIKQ